MSRDGYLPDDVTEDMVPGNRPGDEHHPDCPQHEDAPRAFQCGGHEEHLCTLIEREVNGCELVDVDCDCDDRAEQAESDRADAAHERRREGV